MNPGTDWMEQGRRLLETLRAGLAEAAPAGDSSAASEHGADCRWCPVCQAAAVVRGERPEVTAALADVLTTAAEALRTLGTPDGTDPQATEPEAESEDGDMPVAQRIDIA